MKDYNDLIALLVKRLLHGVDMDLPDSNAKNVRNPST
jgi:hypothetical protein